MKKISIIFVIAGLILFAGKVGFSQAAVSHSFQQDIEIAVTGKGGPTLIKQGETKVLSYLPTAGSVNFLVKYKNDKKRHLTRKIQLIVQNGEVYIPEAPDAFREEKEEVLVTPSKNPAQIAANKSHQDYEPQAGKVNIIDDVSSEMPYLVLKLKHEAKDKGDLLFFGEAFTGLSFKPGQTLISDEKVNPGLIEFTVIRKMVYPNIDEKTGKKTQDKMGQKFTLVQQALVYMVTADSINSDTATIVINTNDFFDFADLAGDEMPIRFRNTEEDITLYPKSSDRRLRPLRPNRVSKKMDFKTARSIMWYYYDEKNVQRLAVIEPISGGIINVRAMNQLYDTSR